MRHDLESIGQALKAAVKMLWGMGDVSSGGMTGPQSHYEGSEQSLPSPEVGKTDLKTGK